MSTSLLVSKMKKSAADQGFECDISAHSVIEADRWIPMADVVLVGPQIRYELIRLRGAYPNVAIEPMDMTMYGMMDGAGILREARDLMGR